MNNQRKHIRHETPAALLFVASLAFLVLCLPQLLLAGTTKSGGDYEMSNDIIDAGGRVGADNATYVMTSAFGQPLGFATMTSGGYDLESGFLSGVVSHITLTATATVTAPTAYTGATTDPVPGAKVRYTIQYTNYGEAAQTGGTNLTNAFASSTVYTPSTIVLNGAPKTDAADGDECRYDTTAAAKVVCVITDVPANATGALEFEAIIQ